MAGLRSQDECPHAFCGSGLPKANPRNETEVSLFATVIMSRPTGHASHQPFSLIGRGPFTGPTLSPDGLSMKPIIRFALEKHDGPYETWPLRSRVSLDGKPTDISLPGYTLLHQFE